MWASAHTAWSMAADYPPSRHPSTWTHSPTATVAGSATHMLATNPPGVKVRPVHIVRFVVRCWQCQFKFAYYFALIYFRSRLFCSSRLCLCRGVILGQSVAAVCYGTVKTDHENQAAKTAILRLRVHHTKSSWCDLPGVTSTAFISNRVASGCSGLSSCSTSLCMSHTFQRRMRCSSTCGDSDFLTQHLLVIP